MQDGSYVLDLYPLVSLSRSASFRPRINAGEATLLPLAHLLSRHPTSDAFGALLQFQRRRWCVDDDGTPGPRHLSSETLVKRLMKTYKG